MDSGVEINERFEYLLKTTSAAFGFTSDQIIQKNRKKDVALARMVVFYLARKCLSLSFPQIGGCVGGRDHTTVMHGCEKIEDRMKTDKTFSEFINKLEVSILDSLPYDTSVQKTNHSEIYKSTSEIQKNVFTPEEMILSLRDLDDESKERCEYIIKLREHGWALNAIGVRFGISRERVRQIIKQAIVYEIRKQLRRGKKVDIESYTKRREKELQDASNKARKEEKRERDNEKKDEKKRKERLRELRSKKWSKFYNKCGMCGTIKKPHRTNGYCIDCYSRSPEHRDSCKRSADRRKEETKKYLKDYYKRPEVVGKIKQRHDEMQYGGNRSKALKRDGNMCSICGMSQGDSMNQLGRELYVRHIGSSSDHSLPNLATVCQRCFGHTNFHPKKS